MWSLVIPEPHELALGPPQVSQGMILGEVEYTIWRDAQGKVVGEDGPGVTATEVSEQVGPPEWIAKRDAMHHLFTPPRPGYNQKHIFIFFAVSRMWRRRVTDMCSSLTPLSECRPAPIR